MADLMGMALIFLLSFLGLVLVVLAIFFLWLAYRYDISFSISNKEPKGDDDSHESGT